MMSAQKVRRGGQKIKKIVDVIYGSPLICRTMLTSAAGPVMSPIPTPTLYTAREGQNAAVASKNSALDISKCCSKTSP